MRWKRGQLGEERLAVQGCGVGSEGQLGMTRGWLPSLNVRWEMGSEGLNCSKAHCTIHMIPQTKRMYESMWVVSLLSYELRY